MTSLMMKEVKRGFGILRKRKMMPSPSNFYLSRFRIQCPLGFSEMKQMSGWTLLIYLIPETYEFHEGNKVIDELIALNKKAIEVYLGTLGGEWQLLWASQSEDESWSSIAANGLKGLHMMKEDGKLENVVVPVLNLIVRASGTPIKGSGRNTYSVTMNEGLVQF